MAVTGSCDSEAKNSEPACWRRPGDGHAVYMTNSNDVGSTQKGPERSPATNDNQPETAGHTITGDGTIPADATVQTRDSEIAETVRDDADSHACEGCGQTFEEIGRLLDHECEEDWGGPDPDDDSPTALADGGLKRMEDADSRTTPERAYNKSPQVRKDILAEIVRLNEQHDTVRYSDVRSEDAPQSVRALAFETFLQHATILAMEDLIERGAFHETQTTVKPTEAAVEIVGDRDE